MSKKRFQVVEELDPASVQGVSDIQRNHYLSLGYKPYLMADGRIKWLTQANRVYRTAQAAHHIPLAIKTGGSPAKGRRRRKHSNRIINFVRQNWLILVLVLLALIAIVYVLR